DGRGEAYPSVQYLAVLIWTGPDEPRVIGSGQPQRRDPEHRQRQVHGRELAVETDLSRHDHADHGTAEVGRCHLAQVVPSRGGQAPSRPSPDPATENGNTKHAYRPPMVSAKRHAWCFPRSHSVRFA